jgi:hypothetical protein
METGNPWSNIPDSTILSDPYNQGNHGLGYQQEPRPNFRMKFSRFSRAPEDYNPSSSNHYQQIDQPVPGYYSTANATFSTSGFAQSPDHYNQSEQPTFFQPTSYYNQDEKPAPSHYQQSNQPDSERYSHMNSTFSSSNSVPIRGRSNHSSVYRGRGSKVGSGRVNRGNSRAPSSRDMQSPNRQRGQPNYYSRSSSYHQRSNFYDDGQKVIKELTDLMANHEITERQLNMMKENEEKDAKYIQELKVTSRSLSHECEKFEADAKKEAELEQKLAKLRITAESLKKGYSMELSTAENRIKELEAKFESQNKQIEGLKAAKSTGDASSHVNAEK